MLNKQKVEYLEYIGLGPELKQTNIDIDDEIIDQVLKEFRALIIAYNNPEKGFTARDKIQLLKHTSDYDQLSRKGEWQDSDEPDPKVVP